MYITKERKWHPPGRCYDNNYASGLAETKIPRFYLKQGLFAPNNLMARVKTIWNYLNSDQDPLSQFKELQMAPTWYSAE